MCSWYGNVKRIVVGSSSCWKIRQDMARSKRHVALKMMARRKYFELTRRQVLEEYSVSGTNGITKLNQHLMGRHGEGIGFDTMVWIASISVDNLIVNNDKLIVK